MMTAERLGNQVLPYTIEILQCQGCNITLILALTSNHCDSADYMIIGRRGSDPGDVLRWQNYFLLSSVPKGF